MNVESVTPEKNWLKFGFLQLLCLDKKVKEEAIKEEAIKEDKPVDIIDRKELTSLDKTKNF